MKSAFADRLSFVKHLDSSQQPEGTRPNHATQPDMGGPARPRPLFAGPSQVRFITRPKSARGTMTRRARGQPSSRRHHVPFCAVAVLARKMRIPRSRSLAELGFAPSRRHACDRHAGSLMVRSQRGAGPVSASPKFGAGRVPCWVVHAYFAKSQSTYRYNLFQVPREQASSSSSSEAPAVHSALTCTRASVWGGAWFDPNGAGSASRLVELCAPVLVLTWSVVHRSL